MLHPFHVDEHGEDASQRKKRDQLRQANDQLDQRVQERTQELAQAVKALELEIVGHQRTEEALRRSEERVDLALDAAGIGLPTLRGQRRNG